MRYDIKDEKVIKRLAILQELEDCKQILYTKLKAKSREIREKINKIESCSRSIKCDIEREGELDLGLNDVVLNPEVKKILDDSLNG